MSININRLLTSKRAVCHGNKYMRIIYIVEDDGRIHSHSIGILDRLFYIPKPIGKLINKSMDMLKK